MTIFPVLEKLTHIWKQHISKRGFPNLYNQDLTKINFSQNLDPVSLLATSLPDLESDLGSSIMEMANFRLFWEEL